MAFDHTKQYRHEQHDKDGRVLVAANISTRSERMYRDHAVKFGAWCKATYGCRTPVDCANHIQEYADWLAAQGKSASTIHTYIAGVCRYWQIPMDYIDKPRRVTADSIRSRGVKGVDARSDAKREASPRLYDFAAVVGGRRAEFQALRKNDLVQDESGHWCVRIKRGKGGKYQEQRILPADVDFIKSFFNGSQDFVFSKKEMTNKIDLHHLRALQAQRAYAYYNEQIRDEAFRAQLIKEIRARWEKYNNKKPWNPKAAQGCYHLRGSNRVLAQRMGLPTCYSRLAVLATSVFFLSHWRCDVTVANYLLAK
ncbi:MAG: hypothetical protein IKG86_00675 [Paludibacteraceae bacterium]|nr:hypothetical protein [Paludibacteraceae bacterium]